MKTGSKINYKLLVAIIAVFAGIVLSTLFISSTVAKYTTTGGNGNGTASVAKWGVQIDTIGENTSLFKTQYDEQNGKFAVKSTSDTPATIIAPGTSGTYGYSITGTPEVAGKVTVNVKINYSGNAWNDNDVKNYRPVVFTLKEGDNEATATGNFESENGATVSIEFAADTDLSTKSYTLNWAWAFETGATAEEKAANNVKDTKLATLEQTTPGSTAITVTFSIIVEQIDTLTQSA